MMRQASPSASAVHRSELSKIGNPSMVQLSGPMMLSDGAIAAYGVAQTLAEGGLVDRPLDRRVRDHGFQVFFGLARRLARSRESTRAIPTRASY